MNTDQINAFLAGGNRLNFRQAIIEFDRSGLTSVQRLQVCLEVAMQLQSAQISDAERGERFLRLLDVARLELPELRRLAIDLKSASPAIKNSANLSLPEEIRPLLYGEENKTTPNVVEQPSLQEAAQITEANASLESTPRRSFDTVVLLAADDQAANIGLLTKNDLAQIKVPTLAGFEDFVRSEIDVCACLIDGSFMKGLSPEEQKRALKVVFEFSNFTWVRIHRDGLLLSEPEIAELHKRVCCDPRAPTILRMTLSDKGSMNQSDLANIAIARRPLQVHEQVMITPGELSSGEATILMAAVSKLISSTTLNPSVEVISLTTKFLPGGRTKARVAHIRVNNSSVLVAKIGEKEQTLDEARRFLTFIRPADQDLNPETYFHHSTGVIIFGLVPSGGNDPIVPAPTLEEDLRNLWTADIYGDGPGISKEPDLIAAIKSAIAKIRSIGGSPPAGFASFANPQMKWFDLAERGGRSWGPSPKATTVRTTAEKRFERLATKTSVHGDIHLRNILVRAGREAHLIDYANSGPGHPVIDLVRLELSLYLSAFKQTETAETCERLQSQLNNFKTDAETLLSGFPTLAKWAINRVCIRGMSAARDASLAVLKANGGDTTDYYAAKYLVAWEALLINDLQTGLALTVIASLVDLIS